MKGSGNIVSRQCDVGKSEEVAAAFRWIEDTLGCIHVLVNNAGVLYDGQITGMLLLENHYTYQLNMYFLFNEKSLQIRLTVSRRFLQR